MGDKISFMDFVKQTLADKVEDLNNPFCTDCNECCSAHTMITKAEYETLCDFIYATDKGKGIMQRAMRRIGDYAQQGVLYLMCPFSNEKRCEVYEIRPLVCRQFHCKASMNQIDKKEHFKQCPYTVKDVLTKGR